MITLSFTYSCVYVYFWMKDRGLHSESVDICVYDTIYTGKGTNEFNGRICNY